MSACNDGAIFMATYITRCVRQLETQACVLIKCYVHIYIHTKLCQIKIFDSDTDLMLGKYEISFPTFSSSSLEATLLRCAGVTRLGLT